MSLLYIVEEDVPDLAIHSAKIELESEVGRGTIIKVEF